MSALLKRRKIKGVEFVVNAHGDKKAVLLDLKHHRELWEDFYDTAVARSRANELRESLRVVKRKQRASTPRMQETPGTGPIVAQRVGDYQVVYEIDDDRRTIDVVVVRNRKDVYR